MLHKAAPLALVVAMLVVACGSSSTSGSKTPITLGLVGPLSPPGAVSFGQQDLLGAQLGVKYVNTVEGGVLGGRPLQLQSEDTRGTPADGVSAYRQLVQQYHVPVVFGEVHSSVMLAENELANELGVPNISVGASAPDVVGKHYSIAFSVASGNEVSVGAIVQFAKDQGYKKIGWVVENTDFGTSFVQLFQAAAKTLNLSFTYDIEYFHVPAVDLTPELLKIKAFQPDLIINSGSGQDADAIIDQSTSNGIGPSVIPQIVDYDQPTEPGWWQKHANDGNGLYWLAGFIPTQKLSPAGEWLKTQIASTGQIATGEEMSSFGVVLIIADALNDAKSTDPTILLHTLETGSFPSYLPDPATFPRAPGSYWHHWQAPQLVMHITSANEDWTKDTIITTYTLPPAPAS